MQGQRSIFDPFPEAVDLNQGSNSSNASMDESDDWNNMLSPMERRLLNNDLSNELNFSCVNTNVHHNFRSFSNWDVGESSSRASLQDQLSNDDSRLQEHQHDSSTIHHHDHFIDHGHVESSSSSSLSSSSNHIPMNVNLNIGYGGTNNDDDDDGMGFMDLYKSGKRKALEGSSGQPGQLGQPLTGYNSSTSLNISSNLVNPVPLTRNDQSNTRISSVPESSHTHFGMRGSLPYNLSSGNAPRRPNITSSHQSNRQILINEFLDQTSRNNPSNQQPPLLLPRNTHHFPFGSRNGNLVNSGGYPLERGSTESNFRSLIRNNVQYHNFVPSSETRNSVQDPTNWSLATGSGAPSSSRNSTVWTQHNSNPTMQSQQRLSDFPPWTLFPSSESESGGQRGHFGPFPAGSSSTSEDTHAHTHISSGVHGQRHHGQPFSRSPLEVPSDDWRALAADIEGRQRLISEIRQVLHAMRRGENLRAEDYMLFDPFINGVAELHDRHRDMRLDVDNMSYEELLALEERIGNVNTGLSEDVILKSMKQRKHIAFMAISTQNMEPCCICQAVKYTFKKMDGSDNHLKSKKIVFVTVGTTSFDSLVASVDSDKVKQELSNKGYTHLLIQMGRGSYIPQKSSGEDGSLVVDYFTFSSSIADYLKSASLVISHAGSGSIFETLRLKKPLIVVVNEDLMDNHQSELAEELAERNHLFCARPQTLYQVIQSLELESIIPYQPGDATPVAKLINRFLGFPSD